MLAGQMVLITGPTRYNTPRIGVMGLCHKYNHMRYSHLVMFSVDIKYLIREKSTLQWTALAIVFWKSGEWHPDMSQHQSK